MKTFLNRLSPRFFPAAVLLLTVLLLALILGSLGRQSLDRERSLLLALKEKQADVMVRSIASAARISAMIPEAGFRQLERFVAETAQDRNVAFIAVYDTTGTLAAASQGFSPDEHGMSINEMKERLGERQRTYSMEVFPGFGRLYTMVGRFDPLDSRWVHVRMFDIPSIPGFSEDELEKEHRYFYTLIGMYTADLDAAVGQGMRQALLNGFLLLMLGTVGFYFLILAHGYYSARRTLSDFRQYTLDVIDGMAEGFVNIDRDGIVRTVNPEAEKMLGAGARQAAGNHWRELFRDDGWDPVRAKLAAGQPFYDLEVVVDPSTGSHLAVTAIPVRGHNDPGGMVMFLRDVGEVRGLQDEVKRSERLAALGRLAAGMAHEIRNPLNSIRGFSQHLRSGFTEGSRERDSLEVIIREVDRLNRVITELLNFSRPQEPRHEPVDLGKLAEHTLSLVEREAVNQGVTCVREPDDSAAGIIGDPDQLRQLLLNLVLNSLQAMPDGGVLTVSINTDNGRSAITVSDTGTGIPTEDLDKIFEPFFTSRDGGTGLGLPIVHRIVKDHGAEIRVQSRPGSGTVIRVLFPPQADRQGDGRH